MSEENLTTHWGVNVADDYEGSRKSLACNWIEVMRANPGLADKIRKNQLLESDLVEVRRQFSTIVAVITRQVLPYRSSGSV